MEAIATDFAVDVTKSLITMAASKAFEEIRLIWGFNDDLGRLKKKLSYIQALMGDLGKKKREEKRDLVNLWLQDVKEVACSAENLLNDHVYEMLRRKLEFININSNNNRRPSFKKKWRSYIREPSRSPIVLRVRMTHRVKEILSMFDELYNTATEIGLNPANLPEEPVSSTTAADKKDTLLSESRQSPLTPVFVGRVDDKNKLLQILRSPAPTANQATLPIVAIVGLGGLGKTTLARQLYDHVENGGPFDGQKVWICVSEDFDVTRLLKEMFEYVTTDPCQLTNKGAIIKKLQGMDSDHLDLSQSKRLEALTVVNAGEIMMSAAARSIPQLDSLRELEIGGFKDEEEITKFVSQIKSTPHSHSHSHSHSLSLRKVTLVGWPKVKKMPEQLQHLLPSSTLEYLSIMEFDELEQLPDWIGNLSSLKKLVLWSCKKLKYLPSKQAMMHLSELRIYDCPELKERCEKHSNNENDNNGPPHSESQWPNIEHIPFIDIHRETIQNLH